MHTFYWHDYETWGADPSLDRPSQFAGVRTDEELNVISDPLVIYCQPPVDVWPSPEACLVTGITPQEAQQKGLEEREFIEKIHREFIKPKTCVVGYNSLRFDDEITRYTLYRNFYDPYEREWKNGNSRWDIIDMVRLCYALRPDGIEWPMIDGKPSFKLENLTVANNIEHGAAHDAYSDVAATIALAKLMKDKKPSLYQYVLANKSKREVAKQINLVDKKPLLHISSMFPSERGCAALVVPLAMHPKNKNAVVVYDLSEDPEPLIDLSPEEIRERLFVSQASLPEGVRRIPLKLVHLNKCPILATPKLLDENSGKRLGVDKSTCEKHWQKLRHIDFNDKLHALYLHENFEVRKEVDQKLYDGFMTDTDKLLLKSVRGMTEKESQENNILFEDARYQELFFRYRARYFPSTLSPAEKTQWQEFVRDRLVNGDDQSRGFDAVMKRVQELIDQYDEDFKSVKILKQCAEYMQQHFGGLNSAGH